MLDAEQRNRRGRTHLLVVEDDATFREILVRELQSCGYLVESAGDPDQAEAAIRQLQPSLILLDERLPKCRGTEFLHRLRRAGNEVPVVFLTGFGDIRTAVEAIRAGAFHFMTKPFELDELTDVIDRAIGFRQLSASSVEEVEDRDPAAILVGRSSAMQRVREMIKKVAHADLPVLVTGESGTGKELVARAIHGLGSSRARELVALNCATLQDSLVEAELFGCNQGAFTGADEDRAGLVESADGGILFLDELGELSLAAQAKLLRLLQEKTYRRLGSTKERHASLRLIAATNVDLRDAIRGGRFRQDLYYRLNILEIRLPPLRERREDLVDLLASFYRSHGRDLPEGALAPSSLKLLQAYDWPGNVRELFNLLERVTILAEDSEFDQGIVREYTEASGEGSGSSALPDRLSDMEMLHIHRILDRCDGNRTRAAALLGISPKTLYNKLLRERSRDV